MMTGCPAASTPWLEMIQAPGWPGTMLAVSASAGLALRLMFAPGAARVAAMAGIGRRMSRPTVTPSAKANAA